MTNIDAAETFKNREELYNLLGRLPPGKRLAFIVWCCRRVREETKGKLLVPEPGPEMAGKVQAALKSPEKDKALLVECWRDWTVLAVEWGLDMAESAAFLEKMVRGHAVVDVTIAGV